MHPENSEILLLEHVPWLFESLLGRLFTTTYLIIMSYLKTLYWSGKYSDLIISCGEKQFNVHRNIVCTQCPWIAAACDGNFMVVWYCTR